MFVIGKIVKPQGIKGEVKVAIISSFPDRFLKLKTVFLEKPVGKELAVEKVRVKDTTAYVKFAGVNTRNDAELLRNRELFVPESDLHELDKDSFYLHQLIGLDVCLTGGTKIGVLKSVESYPANDVFFVETADGGEVLIPAIHDVINLVDLSAGKIVINQMDGLLE